MFIAATRRLKLNFPVRSIYMRGTDLDKKNYKKDVGETDLGI